MKNKIGILTSILITLIFSLIAWSQYDFWSFIGLGLCLFSFLIYVDRLGTTIPVLELMLLISALQWIFGAHQSFNFEHQHFKYYMYVEREAYMSVVVPGFLSFMLGILLIKSKLNIEEVNKQMERFVLTFPKAPVILVGIGFLSPIVGRFAPGSLSFVFFLLGNMKFIGAALWLFQPESAKKWVATGIILLLTLLSSIQSGMFHDLLLWSALLFSFIVLRTKMSVKRRLVFISTGFLMAFLIQSVKAEYRMRLLEGLMADQTPTEVFFELIDDRVNNLSALFSDDEYMAEMNVRLNQGWIISAIIEHVPEIEPFADGETIFEAFQSSLLPRFLAPDKKIAGGVENFERFTGLQLGETTSMGTSVIGEAYANFGPLGSWVFMFLWGLFLSLGFNKLVVYGKNQPLIYVFLPLIFLQVVKAETELYVVLNHFLKSLILVFGLLWIFKKYFGWRYEDEEMGERGEAEIRKNGEEELGRRVEG